MMNIDVTKLVPAYLLRDRNGWALAKAMERGLNLMCQHAQEALERTLDVEKMPEWRLDEMAKELNCLYNYEADVETKRYWIRNAEALFSVYGTPAAIYNYLPGSGAQVEEYGQYGGDSFHFRVSFPGVWEADRVKWAEKVINTTKNVRSVLDSLRFRLEQETLLYAGTVLHGMVRTTSPVEGAEADEYTWLADENGSSLTDERGLLLFE